MLKRMFLVINLSVLVFFGMSFSFSKINEDDKHNSIISSVQILENQSYIDNEVIVTLNSEISDFENDYTDTIFSNFNSGDVKHINKISVNARGYVDENKYKQIYKVKLNDDQSERLQETINDIYDLPGVYYVEPSYTIEIEKISNDPLFINGDLWGLNGTNGVLAPDAWDVSTGSSDVRVGIIDTGILDHEDLEDNLVTGWSTYSNSAVTNNDANGHGTHVAGTIGAVGNNNIGVVGLNWEVSLVPIQANNGIGDTFQLPHIIEAINYATNLWGLENQIDILNFSISGYGTLVAIREEVSNYPGLFVWAAGNSADNIDVGVANNGTFDLPNIISVGASTSTGQRWSNSNYSQNNSNVNIYAPGDNIMSTVPRWRNWIWESWKYYRAYSGTSMAAPHVTGVAALILSINPDLTAAELKSIIIDSADNVTITIPNGIGGTETQVVRRLNAYEAVKNVVRFNTRILSDNTIEIIDTFGVQITGIIEIPSFITNRLVTSISNLAFANQTQLTQIIVPNSVSTIDSNAFQNTNNAPIYLNGRTSAPSTFDVNWNSSGNPVYLNGYLCTHSSTTLTKSNHLQHGDLCDNCRTFVNKSNHNHNVEHIPLGTAPSGIAMHASYCACGHSVTVPCVGTLHIPGQPTTCMYCGQEFSNPLFMLMLPNGETFVSNAPFTYDMFEQLVEHLELSYNYADFVFSVRSNIVYDEYDINLVSILPNRKEISYECCE